MFDLRDCICRPLVPSRVPSPAAVQLDDTLKAKMLSKLEYYFSPRNLAQDTYLRGRMVQGGFVRCVIQDPSLLCQDDTVCVCV